MSRYDPTDFEGALSSRCCPTSREACRDDDRRALNGVFWVLRSNAPWRDLPERFGARATRYNRFMR
jgi:transposase